MPVSGAPCSRNDLVASLSAITNSPWSVAELQRHVACDSDDCRLLFDREHGSMDGFRSIGSSLAPVGLRDLCTVVGLIPRRLASVPTLSSIRWTVRRTPFSIQDDHLYEHYTGLTSVTWLSSRTMGVGMASGYGDIHPQKIGAHLTSSALDGQAWQASETEKAHSQRLMLNRGDQNAWKDNCTCNACFWNA
jgi:hypothetical protein